ncbi:phospho-sugar mutase [Symmachiella dynata]|uniref:phospho-sugar mutase n=1 Tax=Symmachiella dynata TaxID=2527995 RepID=UPI0030EBD6D0
MSSTTPDERLRTAIAKIETATAENRLTPASVTNASRWLTESYLAEYVPDVLALVDADRFEELDRLFWEVIPFGTGGRRGLMADIGSATINNRTIGESAQGLAVYMQQATGKNSGVAVVTSDTRLRSHDFAKLTATTFAANGLKVYLFESPRATPELSFAVRHLKCDVGAMVSASHNPPSDNGFKAYWSTGGQVLPPHDKGIIDCVYQCQELATIDFDEAVAAGKIEIIGAEVDRAYIANVLAMSLSQARDIKAVFTPLHGVGETAVYRAAEAAGFEGVTIFEPQRAADGNFPNVPDQLPNPERPEVFAPAIEQARAEDAALVLASDPDADRLGIAVRNGDGEYVHVSGNRIGVLIADYILRKRKEAGTLSPEHYVVETLVTTPLIAKLAQAADVRAIDDLLVGFKYIGQTMDREGPDNFVFGAEESLGYLAGQYARDKDAAIAGLYILELAAELHAEGKTLLDRLDEIYVEHGYFTESQTSLVSEGPTGKAQIDALMQTFRDAPPAELAGITLSRARDYGTHEIRSLPDNARVEDLPQPQGDLVFFDSAPGEHQISFAARPSGTEPKIKFYYFAQASCPNKDALTTAKTNLEATLTDFKTALTNWVKTVVDN